MDAVVLPSLLLSGYLLYKKPHDDRVQVQGRDRWFKVRSHDSGMALRTLQGLLDKMQALVDAIVARDVGHKYHANMRRIQERLKTVEINESRSDSVHTSYSVNKGEELVFCIRSKRTGKFHALNELLYVAVHELAHIGTPEVGHTPLFADINRFMLRKAVEYKIYQFIDYSKQKREYCGITLSTNILQ